MKRGTIPIHPGKALFQKLQKESVDGLFLKYEEYLKYLQGRKETIQGHKDSITIINKTSQNSLFVHHLDSCHSEVIKEIRSQLFLNFNPQTIIQKFKLETYGDINEYLSNIRKREEIIFQSRYNIFRVNNFSSSLLDWEAIEEVFHIEKSEIEPQFLQKKFWETTNQHAFENHTKLYSYFFSFQHSFSPEEMDSLLEHCYLYSIDERIQEVLSQYDREKNQKQSKQKPQKNTIEAILKERRREISFEMPPPQLPEGVKSFINDFTQAFISQTQNTNQKTLKYIKETFEESYLHSDGEEINVIKRVIKLYETELSVEQLRIISYFKQKWETILASRKRKQKEASITRTDNKEKKPSQEKRILQQNASNQEIIDFLRLQEYEIENTSLLLGQFEKIFTSQPNKRQGFINFLNGKSGKSWQARPNGFFRINFGDKNAPHLISTRNGKITIVDFLTYEDYKKKYVENLYTTK